MSDEKKFEAPPPPPPPPPPPEPPRVRMINEDLTKKKGS